MISFSITDEFTLQDIYNSLKKRGVKNVKSKKLKFSVDQGLYVAAVRVSYEGKNDDSEIVGYGY